MTIRQHREGSGAILIDIRGRFLFQQRDDIPGILNPGKIALFGGHREGNESFLQCIVREVFEETSYYVPPERFSHLTSWDWRYDNDFNFHGEYFVANDIPADELLVTEGALLVVAPEQVASVEARFSPSARSVLSVYLQVGAGTKISIRL